MSGDIVERFPLLDFFTFSLLICFTSGWLSMWFICGNYNSNDLNINHNGVWVLSLKKIGPDWFLFHILNTWYLYFYWNWKFLVLLDVYNTIFLGDYKFHIGSVLFYMANIYHYVRYQYQLRDFSQYHWLSFIDYIYIVLFPFSSLHQLEINFN
jgi:hypothetical protein